MNIEEIRSLFPTTKEAVYLNSASQTPLSTLVNDKLQENLNIELNPIGKKGFNRNEVRELLSKILGGKPTEYALTTSTSIGIGIIAQGLELKAGDNIVLPEKEHWNNIFPWLQLQKIGVEIRFVKLNENNSFDPEAFEKLIDENTKVVTLAAVRFNSGFRSNLKAIGKIAHQHNALFVVDVAQAAGMIPLNVQELEIDIMSGCGFKWLLGMHGTGFLYVNEKVNNRISPILPGMFAADHHFDKLNFHEDARRFETGTIAYSLFSAWTEGLQLILKIGVENIYNTALINTDIIIKGLQEKGYKIISPIKNREERTAIVHFNTGSFETTKALYKKLTDNKVLVTLQGENIRVSPNFFTSEEEIRTFLDLL